LIASAISLILSASEKQGSARSARFLFYQIMEEVSRGNPIFLIKLTKKLDKPATFTLSMTFCDLL